MNIQTDKSLLLCQDPDHSSHATEIDSLVCGVMKIISDVRVALPVFSAPDEDRFHCPYCGHEHDFCDYDPSEFITDGAVSCDNDRCQSDFFIDIDFKPIITGVSKHAK